MKQTTSWLKCFSAFSEIEMVDPSKTDGDLVFEVSRTYDGVFDEEFFDVEVFMVDSKPQIEVHEGGYELTDEERITITQMVHQHLNHST